MPILRNRLVLRIARGLTGFVNFEAGLTRGDVPNVELPEDQMRELRQSRNKLKEQDQQLATLKAQLSRRDKRIEQLSGQSGGHPADESVDLQKEARLSRRYREKIAGIRSRLHVLGFADRAFEDLQDLVMDSSQPALRRLAAWELILWYANQYSEEGAQLCLELLPVARQGEDSTTRLRQAAVIEAECQEVLGDVDAARLAISQALAREPHVDLFLARANLEVSTPARLEWINKALQLHEISRISCDASAERSLYDSLRPGQDRRVRSEASNDMKVTVIVPAYNAEDVIPTALDSVLSQTWTNLEVLVVDDCSTDATASIVEDYAQRDSRVHLIRSRTNGGTYVTRNLALKVATGEFVTCQDADDWSHPEKIERQIRHLLDSPSVVGNTSQQARTTNDLRFYRRGNRYFLLPNTSSFMFRREPVTEAVGYWDCVRFGADNELIQRVKKVFGSESTVNMPTGPLSFVRQSSNSLTGNAAFGIHAGLRGARLEYREAYTYFHDTAQNLRYEFPQINRPFAAPEPMWPVREVKETERRHFDVILASDFRFPGGTTSSNVEEIKAQARIGLRTGLMQMSHYDFSSMTINQKVRDLIDGERVQMLVYGEKVSCDVLVLRHPPILQELQQFVPSIEAANVHCIVDQTPLTHYGENGEVAYTISRCEKHLQKHFGKPGLWHPIGPLIREALHQHHAEELKKIPLAKENWSDIIDVGEWKRDTRPLRTAKTRIGRHSSDLPYKWPGNRSELLAIYPDSNDYEVHILGGARTPERVLGGYIPDNWRVLEFGKASPKDFLSTLDVFVYYTHPDMVEAFGRVIIEAMAVGVPVILPPVYRSLFEEAAIYAEPPEVGEFVNQLMGDDAYYEAQVELAHAYVEKHFGYAKHAERLGKQVVSQVTKGWRERVVMREANNEQEQKAGYWAGRSNLMYYQYIDYMVRALATDANSLIDVGSADAQYIENFDWIPRRHALDIDKPYNSENVAGIEMDFFDFEPDEKYDFATCLQVLEHVPDAKSFVRKLFQVADRVLISVPYTWEKGRTKSHVHDPVDLDKVLGWAGREPDYHIVVKEPLTDPSNTQRLICYYHSKDEKLSFSKARRNAHGNSTKRIGASDDTDTLSVRERQLYKAIKNERERSVKREVKLKRQAAELKEARKNHEKVVQERDRLNHLYAAILQSRTWRYTLPARKIGSVLKRFVRK